MLDVAFRRENDIFYVKRRKGFYDVLQGIELTKIGHVVHSFGQWCFCPASGDWFYYGNTRSEAVADWMMSLYLGGADNA